MMVLLVFAVFCMFSAVSKAEVDANMVVDTHNELRSALEVTNVAWDPALAKVAQAWVSCS